MQALLEAAKQHSASSTGPKSQCASLPKRPFQAAAQGLQAPRKTTDKRTSQTLKMPEPQVLRNGPAQGWTVRLYLAPSMQQPRIFVRKPTGGKWMGIMEIGASKVQVAAIKAVAENMKADVVKAQMELRQKPSSIDHADVVKAPPQKKPLKEQKEIQEVVDIQEIKAGPACGWAVRLVADNYEGHWQQRCHFRPPTVPERWLTKHHEARQVASAEQMRQLDDVSRVLNARAALPSGMVRSLEAKSSVTEALPVSSSDDDLG